MKHGLYDMGDEIVSYYANFVVKNLIMSGWLLYCGKINIIIYYSIILDIMLRVRFKL